MINWTEELLTEIETASRVALSYQGVDGYPVALPLPLDFDRDNHRFILPIPQQRPASASEEQVSLTLLFYDQQMKFERYLLFYGHLNETGNEWIFTPSDVVLPRWRRRA
jgi:hypothetical protein